MIHSDNLEMERSRIEAVVQRRMPPSPSPPLRLDIPQIEQQQQNGFHSISLRSPADKPVILGFDGNGAVCNGSIGISANGEKSPAEGNSQGQLIETTAISSRKPSKLPPASLRSICKFLSSRRFLLALVAFLTIFALLLIITLVFVILKWGKQQHLEDAEFLNRDSSWRDGCERKCNAKFDVPPLLLISMDGFRADYLQRKITPSVQRIMQCGAHAEYMLPSYPSKTFPNHYTIVTGLYPESHGIVDNHFYDEEMPDEKNFAKSSRNPIWYNGEPIWNTVTKNGKKSAIFFWPGSEVPIQGMLPTYRYNYNASLPFSKRVDQVIDWLRLDETDRPAFLAMYFEQPDTAMHREGPDSDAVNSALIYVDAMINYLMQQLDNNGFLGCINLVILSDHGAQKLREDHFIAMDQFVDARDPNVGGVFGGTIGHINFKKSASQAFIERVLAPMSCRGGQTFRVYTRDSMPKRYHYTKSGRIGEIVIDSVGGTRLFVDQRSMKEHGSLEKGDHGYDNRMREMRAIFGAWGHSIKRAYEEKPFQNIELYNLFTALMQLPVTAPNNGTIGRLHSILREPPSIDSTPSVELAECDGARLVKCGDGCHFELNYQSGSVSVPSSSLSADDSSNTASSSSSANSPSSSGQQSTNKVPVYNGQHCKYAERILMPANFASQGRQCIIRLCNSTLVFNRRLRMANFVESLLTAPIPNIDHRANCTAHFVVPNPPTQRTSPTVTSTADGQMATTTMAGQREEGITVVKRSRSTDDDDEGANADDEDSHLISEPTDSSTEGEQQNAPWDRPAEMGDNAVNQTAVETTTTMNLMHSGPPLAENETATMANDGAQPIQPSPTVQSPQQLECARLQQQHQNLGPPSTPTSIDSNALWISLFPDNDYARYIFQGQFRVPQGFYNGPWKQILTLIRQYVQHYKRLLMWSGPVFDHDHDGLADPLILNGNNNFDDSTDGPMPSINVSPSHIFLILLRCSNNTWATNGRQCEDPKMTKTLAFVLPLVEKDLNCLFPVEYIFRHTARIMDIELLTGNEWFLDRQIYPQELAIQLRTKINEQLWQLELKT